MLLSTAVPSIHSIEKRVFQNTHFQKNKHRDINEWLNVTKIFDRAGKQGLVGIVVSTSPNSSSDSSSKNNNYTYIFKISQYIDYLCQHEWAVMSALNGIADFCPHFCHAYGMMQCRVDPTKRKEGNPFEMKSSHCIQKEVLFMEYLENSRKFYSYITSRRTSKTALLAVVKQVLMALSIAQTHVRFTHYDLHSNNIMVQPCGQDDVLLYVLDEDTQFCVPTRGLLPTIIDFGFSYAQTMEKQPLWSSLNHTDVGFLSDRFSPTSDPKLFLTTISKELVDERRCTMTKTLRNVAKNIYQDMKLDWLSGWDTDTRRRVTDKLCDRMAKHTHKKSKLFREFECYCVDILQSLVQLPLEEQTPQRIEQFDITFPVFLSEFFKIENEIGTPFYCLYILKATVDAARDVRKQYLQQDTRHTAVKQFRRQILEQIDAVASYCLPKKVNYETMLCSLLGMGCGIEGILYESMSKCTQKKFHMYDKIPLQRPEQVYTAVEVNIPDTYKFHTGTRIIVVDCIRRRRTLFPRSLTEEEAEDINSYRPLYRGTHMYEKMKNEICQQEKKTDTHTQDEQ